MIRTLQAQQAWDKVKKRDLKLVKCPCEATSHPPVGKHDSVFVTIENALHSWLAGINPGYSKTVIVKLCNMRDYLQNNSAQIPLVMFYFPLVAEKIRSRQSTPNTLATLKQLKKYYANCDVDNFLRHYDQCGAYFHSQYLDTIEFFRDPRYSYLYQPFVPAVVQFSIEHDNQPRKFWLASRVTMTFGNVSDEEAYECIRLFLWLQELFPQTKKLMYNIKFILTDHLKELPETPGEFIGPKHVNSGYSISQAGPQRSIFIYRREEHLKVLIHEFLHTAMCNFAVVHDPQITAFLNSLETKSTPQFVRLNPQDIKEQVELRFNHEHLQNPNEALTEISANILIIIWRLVSTGQPMSKFKAQFNTERDFALQQCAKILNYFGFTKVEQLLGGSDLAIKQTTNVVPYYILRAMLYYDPQKLFAYYSANGSLCYYRPSNGTEILRDMLTKFSPEFRQKMNELLADLRSGKTKMTSTMRMTIGG